MHVTCSNCYNHLKLWIIQKSYSLGVWLMDCSFFGVWDAMVFPTRPIWLNWIRSVIDGRKRVKIRNHPSNVFYPELRSWIRYWQFNHFRGWLMSLLFIHWYSSVDYESKVIGDLDALLENAHEFSSKIHLLIEVHVDCCRFDGLLLLVNWWIVTDAREAAGTDEPRDRRSCSKRSLWRREALGGRRNSPEPPSLCHCFASLPTGRTKSWRHCFKVCSESFSLGLGADTASNATLTQHEFWRMSVTVDVPPEVNSAVERPVIVSLLHFRQQHPWQRLQVDGQLNMPTLLQPSSEIIQ